MQYSTLMERVRHLAPEERNVLDSPYTISNELYAALRSVLHDVGGQPDAPAPFLEKGEEEWEMNTYLTCEVICWRTGWNAEMRRRSENDLGATMYFGLPYYARWITGAARYLVDAGLITTDELGRKIDEIRARQEART
ncbi:SH3-like domain-containing protein [Actinomadura sp. WMMA1423]|uniref:SH3-like domain-containing protein n=1 Tax=Actinomadura sp. WMMA1423 TaxID=2591108 RepID=UPI001146F4F2|nr:SH3-like domain-containing protein [Actinomadura sp. WMMA1423]